MKLHGAINRRNLLSAVDETFRPPLFSSPNSVTGSLVYCLRLLFDLQALSIRLDLGKILPALSGRVVDAGCGAQVYRNLLAPAVTYTGIDSAGAHEQFGYRIPDTIYYTGDRWPVDDESADAVLSTEVLEHVEDAGAFLTEACRCLKPGGTFVATVPFSARWHYVPHDYWRFTPSGLASLCTKAGFAGLRVYARGNPLTVAAYKTASLIHRLAVSPKKGAAVALLRRCAFVLLSPVLAVATLAGVASLLFDWGEDCLGYTIIASKPERS